MRFVYNTLMDNEESNWTYTGGDAQLDSQNLEAIESVSWEASEYVAHEKPLSWYLILYGASVAITALVYLINRDILTAVAILTVTFCAGFFASRKPASKHYELSEKGLQIDSKLFQFSTFKSFSIVEDGALSSIWLKQLGKYQPNLVLYFSPEDEDKIVNVLSHFLPFEQRELDAIDRATRRLRF